ncbi:MAG TPA: hypothetical protein VMA74_05890 [Dyella sp.]|uniref:hypothetical protein n=1 Tax=Dyella sp. TaxID=1869338 RepID=UPI002BDE4E25|nr:hypothetical protein [Dyella sp.]HUB89247.1 hypothetical protein [Dyella sp.]
MFSSQEIDLLLQGLPSDALFVFAARVNGGKILDRFKHRAVLQREELIGFKNSKFESIKVSVDSEFLLAY